MVSGAYHEANLSPIQLNENSPTSIIDQLKNNRSVFDLSQAVLTTIQADLVYPIFWEEIIPSDTFKINTGFAGRLATPLYPTMDNLHIQYDWWFIPHRLVWPHFKNMFGEREISGSNNVQTNYIVPIIDDTSKEYAAAAANIRTQGFGFKGLTSYLLAGNDVGRPMDSTKGNYITSLLHRSYMLTGYCWYLDQVYGSVFINDAGAVEATGFISALTGDGPDDCTKFQLFKKGKKKNYFTQLRSQIMDGTDGSTYLTDVLGAFVPLQTNTYASSTTAITRVSSASSWDIYLAGSSSKINNQPLHGSATGYLDNDAGTQSYSFDPKNNLSLDLSNLGISINNIRLYEQVQRYYERASRSGNRYVEHNFATYGVTPEDQRLQLPEWLGGWTERLNMSPVAQTSSTSGANALGQLAAFGTLISHAPTITKSFTEHGYIMCLATVFPDQTFQQGINRKLNRRTKYDFHDPLWENLTEQPVYKRELRIANDATDAQILGYGPRFSEMKAGVRKLSGLMRSTASGTLHAWHYAQNLPTSTVLDTVFRCYNTDMARTQAYSADLSSRSEEEANISAARPMQVNPVPLLGAF
ncbi:major capsid protein [Microviridae sp.]|nr:major capsid protein [Microviridae sp.]